MMMEGVAMLLPAPVPPPLLLLVVGPLPAASSVSTRMTRFGHELSMRRAAAITSSMTCAGCAARVESATCVRAGSEAGEVPRKPVSVDVYRCVTLRKKGSPKCTGAGRPRW